MRFAAPFAAVLLAACGQTGALYLPDEGVETPVEIRGPAAAPAPEAPPAPEDEAATPEAVDEDDEKKDRPEPPAGP